MCNSFAIDRGAQDTFVLSPQLPESMQSAVHLNAYFMMHDTQGSGSHVLVSSLVVFASGVKPT